MGTGFLTGAITSRADLKDGDFRKAAHGRMTDESFDKACVPSAWTAGNHITPGSIMPRICSTAGCGGMLGCQQ